MAHEIGLKSLFFPNLEFSYVNLIFFTTTLMPVKIFFHIKLILFKFFFFLLLTYLKENFSSRFKRKIKRH